jgi:hypothetical protein
MQFTAIRMLCRISNPLINEQNVAALRRHKSASAWILQMDEWGGYPLEYPTAQLEVFALKEISI